MESRRGAEGRRLRDAYVAERERLVVRRVPYAGRAFLIAMGVVAVVEAVVHPARTTALLGVFMTQVVLCLGAIPLVRHGGRWIRASMLTGCVAVGLTTVAMVYMVRVGSSSEHAAMALVCLVGGASLLLPWGGLVQAGVSVVSCVAFTLLVPGAGAGAEAMGLWMPVVVVSALAIGGAHHVDRYREDAFVRASLEEEEARTSAALGRVGEALHAHLRAPDALDRMCGVAREVFPCDWVALYPLDGSGQRYRLQGLAGPADAAARTAFADYEPTEENLPLLREMRYAEVVEIRDGRRQTLVPASLVERFRIGAALYAPMRRDGHIVGVIAFGFVAPRADFADRERRLALGIAHVTAVAVENLELMERLAAASRLKSEFVATMSHELRSPLSVISGYTELLDEEAFGPVTAAQRDTLGRIRQNTQALCDLVDMTLDLGRLEIGREVVTPSMVALHDLVEEIRREQVGLVPADVRHRWDYDPALVVAADRAKVKAIIKNLVGNALKFTTAGRVDVRIAWRREELEIEVEDTGIGIAAEDLAVVFEMFRQVDSSASRRYEGVGLGLHIVQRLAILLGGDVDVESEPGRGSRFRVRFPCPRIDVGDRRTA